MDDLFESTTPLPAPPEPKAEAHPESEMPFFPDFALREALVALVFLCVLLLVNWFRAGIPADSKTVRIPRSVNSKM